MRASNTCLAGFFAILEAAWNSVRPSWDAAAAFLRIRKPRPARTRLGRDRIRAGCGSKPMVPWGRLYVSDWDVHWGLTGLLPVASSPICSTRLAYVKRWREARKLLKQLSKEEVGRP